MAAQNLSHRVGRELLVATVYLLHFRKHQLDGSISRVKIYLFHEGVSPSDRVASRSNYVKGKIFNFSSLCTPFPNLFPFNLCMTPFLMFREINLSAHTVYQLRVFTPLTGSTPCTQSTESIFPFDFVTHD